VEMELPDAIHAYNARDLTILQGAVPEAGRGLLHTVPTYLCRSPGITHKPVVAVPL